MKQFEDKKWKIQTFTNERSAARRHTAVSVITYILLTLWALIVLVSFLLDGPDLCKKLQFLQRGAHSQLFYPDSDHAELCRRIYGGASGKISSQYPYFHIGHHRHYDGRDHPLRFCFCKA